MNELNIKPSLELLDFVVAIENAKTNLEKLKKEIETSIRQHPFWFARIRIEEEIRWAFRVLWTGEI